MDRLSLRLVAECKAVSKREFHFFNEGYILGWNYCQGGVELIKCDHGEVRGRITREVISNEVKLCIKCLQSAIQMRHPIKGLCVGHMTPSDDKEFKRCADQYYLGIRIGIEDWLTVVKDTRTGGWR